MNTSNILWTCFSNACHQGRHIIEIRRLYHMWQQACKQEGKFYVEGKKVVHFY